MKLIKKIEIYQHNIQLHRYSIIQYFVYFNPTAYWQEISSPLCVSNNNKYDTAAGSSAMELTCVSWIVCWLGDNEKYFLSPHSQLTGVRLENYEQQFFFTRPRVVAHIEEGAT